MYLNPHRFGHGDEHRSRFPSFARYYVVNRLQTQERRLLLRGFWLGMVAISRASVAPWAILRFDAFVFCCWTSYFNYREVPLFRLLDKRIIYNFHGTDSRPGFKDGFAENAAMSPHLRKVSGYIGYVDEGMTGEEKSRDTIICRNDIGPQAECRRD